MSQRPISTPKRQCRSPVARRCCYFACVNVTNVVGVNLAIAVNAATINSQANALAMQYLASVQMP